MEGNKTEQQIIREKVLVELADEMAIIMDKTKQIRIKGDKHGISFPEIIKFAKLVKKVFDE